MNPRRKKRLIAAAVTAGIAAWLTFGIFSIHWNNDPVHAPRGVNQFEVIEPEPAPSPGPAPQAPRTRTGEFTTTWETCKNPEI